MTTVPTYDYAFYGVAAGNYKVEFHNYALGWLPEFYNDKRTMDEADVIVYDGATPRTGIDCTFDPAPVSIGGTVHSADAQNSLQITLYREIGDPGSGMWEWADSVGQMDAGQTHDYAFYGLTAGNYKVEFRNYLLGWLPEFYNDKRTMDEADVIVYDGATPRTGIDCTFDPAPVSIGGTVRSADAENDLQITLYRQFDWGWMMVDGRYTMIAGPEYKYAFYGLDAGNYKVEFHNVSYGWLPEFYKNRRTMEEADAIVYDGATPQAQIDCTFDPIPPTQQADDLLAFYREGISMGSLYGTGTGRTAAKRAATIEGEILVANKLVHRGNRTAAVLLLHEIYHKCDGKPRPSDFVDGMQRAELASRVQKLVRALGGRLW